MPSTGLPARAGLVSYLLAEASWEPTKLNIEFNWVPSVTTAATIATEIPAAINPYSMAVVADSSLKKRAMSPFICLLPECAPAGKRTLFAAAIVIPAAGEGRRRQTKEAQLTDGRHWTLVVFFNSTACCRIGE